MYFGTFFFTFPQWSQCFKALESERFIFLATFGYLKGNSHMPRFLMFHLLFRHLPRRPHRVSTELPFTE